MDNNSKSFTERFKPDKEFFIAFLVIGGFIALIMMFTNSVGKSLNESDNTESLYQNTLVTIPPGVTGHYEAICANMDNLTVVNSNQCLPRDLNNKPVNKISYSFIESGDGYVAGGVIWTLSPEGYNKPAVGDSIAPTGKETILKFENIKGAFTVYNPIDKSTVKFLRAK